MPYTRILPHLLSTTLVLGLLAGCGSIKESVTGFMSDSEDSTVKPNELVQLENTLQVDELWSVNIGGGTDKQFYKLHPVVDEQGIFAADRSGEITAVDRESGRKLWNINLKLPISGGPGIGEGLAIVGTSDGEVIALAALNGQRLWKTRVSSEVLSTPVISSGVAVVRTGDGKVHGLDASDGKRLWVYDRSVPALSLRGTSSPVIAGENVVVGFDNGRLGSLALTTGKPQWEARIVIPTGRSELDRMVDIDADPLILRNTIYVATYQGQVSALDLDTGRNLWARDISSYAGLAADNEYIYVTDELSHVWALNRQTGNSVWKQEAMYERQLSAPAVIGNYVVVGDYEGYLHWMDKDSGDFVARTRADDSKIIVPPTVVDDLVIVYSSGGVLSAFRTY